MLKRVIWGFCATLALGLFWLIGLGNGDLQKGFASFTRDRIEAGSEQTSEICEDSSDPVLAAEFMSRIRELEQKFPNKKVTWKTALCKKLSLKIEEMPKN